MSKNKFTIKSSEEIKAALVTLVKTLSVQTRKSMIVIFYSFCLEKTVLDILNIYIVIVEGALGVWAVVVQWFM